MTTYDNLKPWNLLYRNKGFVKHAGVYLGNNNVVHCVPDNGVEIIDLEKFKSGESIQIIKTDNLDVDVLTGRINRILASNEKYCLFSNNCQHIANLLMYGKSTSPQLNRSLAFGAGGLVIGQVREENKFLWGLFGLAFGALTYSPE